MQVTKPILSKNYESFHLPGEAFIRINQCGDILFINEAATRLTSFTLENSKGNIRNIFEDCILENNKPPEASRLPYIPKSPSHLETKDTIIGILNTSKKRIWLSIHTQPSKLSMKGEIKELLVTIKPHLFIEPATRGIATSSLSAVFDCLPESVIILSRDLEIDYFNKEGASFFLKFLHKKINVGDKLSPDLLERFNLNLVTTLKEVLEGKTFEFKLPYHPGAGDVVMYLLKIFPLMEDQAVKGVMLQFRDISIEYNLQKHLSTSNERLETAINASKDIVWEAVIDRAGKMFLLLPMQFAELTGYFPEEVVTVDELLAKIVHPEDQGWIQRLMEKSARNKSLSINIPAHRFICKNGEIKHVTMKAISFKDSEGNVNRMVGITNDVTENYLLQKELESSNKRYEMASLAAADNFWELDIKTDLLYFNPENMTRAFGFVLSSPMPFKDYLHQTRHQDSHHLINEYYHSIRNASGDYCDFPIQKIRRGDGSTGYASIKTIYLRNEKGEAITIFGTSRDITDKYIAEQEVRKSNERYELAARASFDLLWDIDIATGLLTFSSGVTDMYGHNIVSPIPDREFVKSLVHPDDQQQLFDATRSFIMSTDLQREFPGHRIVRKDGSIAYMMVRVLALREPNNRMTRMIGVSRDITASYLIEQEMRKSNERYEMASHASFDMIWERDYITGRYYFSDAMSKIFGHNNNEVWTDELVETRLMHPDDNEMVMDFMKAAIKEKKKYVHCPPHRYIKKDGSIAYVHVHGITMYNDKGEPERTVGVSRDITHIRLLEEKMAKEEIHHLQHIAKITIETQESEREEIGRELHDNINQILAAVKLNLDMAIKREDQRLPILTKSYGNIEQAIQEIRQLSHTLISPVMDIGLVDTIYQLIDQVTTPVSPVFTFIPTHAGVNKVEKTVQLMLYRIAQEQINNILKHAKASAVEIKLYAENNKLCLKITDNGVGFDTQKKHAGIGIRNIKNRVKLYQGAVKITSKPGKGCILGVCIPMNISENH